MIPKTQQIQILKNTREWLSQIIQTHLQTNSQDAWYKANLSIAGMLDALIGNLEQEISQNAYVCVKCLKKAKIANPSPITSPNSIITQSNSDKNEKEVKNKWQK